MPNARSRASGYFHLNDHPEKIQHPKTNGPILVECEGLKRVVSSAAEVETAREFCNAQIATQIRHMLESLNYPQLPTPLKTDNSTAHGFATNNTHQKKSKSWDMTYHWLRDRELKNKLKCIGRKEPTTMRTMLLNIIRLNTMCMFVKQKTMRMILLQMSSKIFLHLLHICR